MVQIAEVPTQTGDDNDIMRKEYKIAQERICLCCSKTVISRQTLSWI
jgi:hypothetical protein